MRGSFNRDRPIIGALCIFAILLLPALAAFGWQAASAAWGDQTADSVLGQTNFTNKDANQGLPGPTANTLWNPAGVTVDRSTGAMFVADWKNHRIQIWESANDFATNDPADISISSDGQGALELDPVAVVTDVNGNLYVAELVNNRVIVCPPPLFTPCSYVIGQPDFATVNAGAPSASLFNGPVGLAVDDYGHLYVADSNNNRVLRFTLPITANNQAADLVLGQSSFVTNAINRGNGTAFATSDGLYNPQGVSVDAAGNVYVADMRNNRVLRYVTPLTNGKAASLVLGQANFSDRLSNRGMSSPAANTMNMPNSLAVDRYSRLFVGDCQNNRVLGFELDGSTNGADARLVVGQPNFGSAGYNPSGDPSAVSLALAFVQPSGVATDDAMNLYVTDPFVNRVVRYDAPWPWTAHLPAISKQ